MLIIEPTRYNQITKQVRRYHKVEGEKTHVVVTRLGDYWVTQDQARKIAESLGASKFITLEGSMISTYSIDGILTPEQYKTNASQRGRSWRCKYGNVHAAAESCRCSIALNPPKKPAGEIDISPELKAERAARAKAIVEYTRKNFGNPSALKDKAAREQYVDQRTAEILAEAAQDDAGEPAAANTDVDALRTKKPRRAARTRAK